MGPHVIVMAPPDFNQDASLGAAAEPFHVEALVAEFTVEALVGAVLPRFAGIDQGGVDLRLGEPFQDRFAHEFRSVIGAQERRGAMYADQAGQHLDDTRGTDAARHVDRQAFPRELVDDSQTFDLLPVGTGIVNEIVGPDLVRSVGRQGSRPRRGNPPSWPASRQLQAGRTPEAIGALGTHGMTLATQEDPDTPVAVARIPGRDASHGVECRRVAFGAHRAVLQHRARHSISSQAWRWECPRSIAKATWSLRACELTIFGG